MEKSELKQIFKSQKQELIQAMNGLQARSVQKNLMDLLSSRLAKVVVGIRRAGKSSLCLKALNDLDVAYANFDDERLLGVQAQDLNTILEALLELSPQAKVFFFDEIQNIEGWELFINRLQRQKYNLLITGSNGKLLSGELATHLTGRHLSFTLYPLSFREVVQWRNPDHAIDLDDTSPKTVAMLSRTFSDFFANGGFPEVVQGEQAGPYLRELFDKVISRDIVQRYGLRSSKSIKELASYLLQNSGQHISIDSLKKTFGITSVSTVQRYIQYLEDCFLIFELRGYSYKLKERSTSPRKIYACDVGMISALWTKPTEDLGARLETIVFQELIKANREIYYLKEDGVEVDFCVVKNRKIESMIQVCYDLSNQKTREREIRALERLARKYKPQTLFIITRDHREIIQLDGLTIQCLPAHEFCLSLA